MNNSQLIKEAVEYYARAIARKRDNALSTSSKYSMLHRDYATGAEVLREANHIHPLDMSNSFKLLKKAENMAEGKQHYYQRVAEMLDAKVQALNPLALSLGE